MGLATKACLIKPLLFHYANQHDKDFKLGDPEVTFALPVGTEVSLEATRTIDAGRSFDHIRLKVCDISFKNPLSGVISYAIVWPDCLE